MALSHYSRYRKWVVSLQVSGPPGLVEHVCGDKEDENSQGELAGLLKEIGYKMEQVYKF
jgi:cytochrome-b5 reductase